MRIQFCQSSYNGCVCHSFHIYSIDIVLLHFLKDEVELAPTVVVSVKLLLHLVNPCNQHGSKHSQDDAQECNENCIVVLLHSLVYLFHFNPCTHKEIDAICKTICIPIYYSPDAGLDYELCTFHARRGSHIESGSLAAVAGLRNLGDCIGLSMEDIWLSNSVFVLTDVFES